jgi:CRP/FNR family transcriptional activator FtrB
MSNEHYIAAREIPLFSMLSEKQLNRLLNMAHLQCYPANTRLIDEGDPAQFLHVILEGVVELFCSSKTRETTMFVLRPISTFNLSAVLEDTVYSMSALTKVKTKVLMIPAENMRELIKVDSVFAHAMVSELAKRYRMLIDAFRENRLCNSTERLANYLLRANAQSSTGLQVELTENRRTLAALLGMSPEHLSRAFNALKQYGVEAEGGKISLTNLDKLRQFSEPSDLVDYSENGTP